VKRWREFSDPRNRSWALIVSPAVSAALVVGCGFQLWWFSRTCFNEIDFDGMSYVGIARHIRQGEFHSAINAFRSPLISWLIAAVPLGHGDYLHVGKLVNMASFLLTVALLYALAKSLWGSRLVAALASFLFAVGRGLAAASVESVTPDFLFAALTLVYFLLLLRAQRKDRVQDWLFLGLAHGVAFLAKAFALPWLAVCSVAALALSGRPWKTRIVRLAAAAVIPAVIASGWAAVLHSKYAVFTTGSQFKANYLFWDEHVYSAQRDSHYAILRDTTKEYDEYVVGDPMPPGSWTWGYRVGLGQALPKIILAERRNVPPVLKELAIVATPGGLLAFVFAVGLLVRRRRQTPVESQFAGVVVVAALSLTAAYCMLCFDSRYLFPLIPLLLAVAAGFMAGETDVDLPQFKLHYWRRICLVLAVVGIAVSVVYRSSPFRTLTRDFQVSCYDAGNRLKSHNASRVVSLGSGPFPEHGVGWEAGYKAAYFGGRRIVGSLDALPDSLPDSPQSSMLLGDVEKASPDAILVWGKADDPRRASLIHSLVPVFRPSSTERILDPSLGEVGVVMFR
jgi:4-amino-4-deoxy-L-arabinose transferase-like glycosyltransferase